ncbi:hypothetical protein [Pseudoalteromonas rubra]|nr:hypothetical protein [Pseudoalteromonas rubra]
MKKVLDSKHAKHVNGGGAGGGRPALPTRVAIAPLPKPKDEDIAIKTED